MREEILEIADKQMKQGGYDNLSFATIAKALDTTRANVHYHFTNKETLAIEVTKRYMADQVADIKKIAAAHSNDFIGFVEAMEDHHWEEVDAQGPNCTCVCSQVLGNSNSPESLVSLAREQSMDVMQVIHTLAVNAQNAGNINAKFDTQRVVSQSAALCLGLMQLTMHVGDVEAAKGAFSGMIKDWAKTLQ